MSLRCSSVVEFPVEEVFAWHARPGAITRLTPPWQPVRVLGEATSLRDGRAVLGFPGGLRWVASHRPDGYRPPHRFVDQLTSLPLSAVLSWRHTHEFTSLDERSTRVTDTVETAVPERALRAMFTYRHAQLRDDLAAHARARAWAASPRTVAVTGSSGLVGRAVTALLTTGGHQVIRLVRRPARSRDERQWRPEDPAPDLLTGVDAVIHLAGSPIAGRFTDAHEAAIRDSRVRPTRRLAELAATGGPSAFVSASAVGYYGTARGDEILTESSPRGDGFLAEVAADWEAATTPAAEAGLRTTNVRTGIVQSPRGGVLALQHPLFSAGLGGRLGDGHQWTPWIGIDDLSDIYLRCVLDPGLSGPVNAVAPVPVRNADHAATLARVLSRPALLPVPELGPRLLLGERGARELAFADQRVHPERLRRAGHRFRHPHLETALRHVFGRPAPGG
ncbi:TIGR01777 family oxidoreductase [Saccharopolyspora sp. TS4A08]|uniref:TIGR01777 family oxidoreductase n=1 Tax=Saccharopolyspora ipomoeae TaxID=3042027 RepID=A0ABT6PWX9_9PSEU|nr:TIGR01777 family oxidoreductase [Saccharopolyspora sp. TS4A08]MDI2032507.1 TIGR01777 family oxidoreductase [Saccharopolyspora sp. TS4A08]